MTRNNLTPWAEDDIVGWRRKGKYIVLVAKKPYVWAAYIVEQGSMYEGVIWVKKSNWQQVARDSDLEFVKNAIIAELRAK